MARRISADNTPLEGGMMLRIGMVGAGVIARDHVVALKEVTGARVVAIADVALSRAQELAAMVGAEATPEAGALIGKVDLVWICSPPFLHAEQVVAFADAKVHVFCEKPFALDLADADRMIAACQRNGVHLMVGQVIRYFPETLEIKRRLEAGEAGEPVLAIGRRLTGATLRDLSPWARDAKLSGGFALESGVHEVDTVRFLAGEVASVSARVRYDDPEHPGFDTDFRALLRMRSGAGGDIANSRYSGLREWAWGVVGTKAALVSRRRGEVTISRMGEEDQVVAVDPVTRADGVNATMLAENQAFVDAVQADREPPIPGREGRRNVEVILAAHQASREDRVVELGPG
jgi:predicted dehydrogenase